MRSDQIVNPPLGGDLLSPSEWSRPALVIGVLLTLVATVLLNRPLGIEVAEGVALLYPAAAVAVVAGALFGWWGVLAVLVGHLASPWGLATTPARTLLFSVASSLQAVAPAVIMPRIRNRQPKSVLFLFGGVVVGALASVLLAFPGLIRFSGQPLTLSRGAAVFASWFLGDVASCLLFGVPVILVLRPSGILGAEAQNLYRSWSSRPRGVILPVAIVIATFFIMEFSLEYTTIGVHWIATLLMIPILYAGIRGGVGAGLMVNAFAGTAYVIQIIRLSVHRETLFTDLMSSYLNLFVFGAAAVGVGLAWSRADGLVRDLGAHRRLLQENFERVVTALAAAVEAKDTMTKGHVQRVAKLVVAVGGRMGLDGRRLEMLRYAAILHDIGKIGVPEAILNKPGPLTREERRIVEKHVDIGVDIVATVDILEPTIPAIRYHQERWDGQTDLDVVKYPGYFGLKGEEIPLEARIIAVVDTYDAIISDRPYRKGASMEVAVEEIRSLAGVQFDPEAVAALCDVVGSEEDISTSPRIPIVGDPLPGWIAD